MEDAYEKARRVWKERKVPVVAKPLKGRLQVQFPTDEQIWPFEVPKDAHWSTRHLKGYWEAPRNSFRRIIPQIAERWGSAYVVQYFVEQKKCAPACRTAKYLDCECACGGEFHGVDGPPGEWLDISETLSVQRGETWLSCRLLTDKAGRSLG